MKEATPHDAQRSAPGSRAHEPIECYAKFRKLGLVSCLTISLQNLDVAWAEERCAPAKIGWGKASFKRIT
jgi:hypothetical protein